MKPTDPTPEEYVKWILQNVDKYVYYSEDLKKATNFILTELRDNSTTEISRLYFNECLTELKKQ